MELRKLNEIIHKGHGRIPELVPNCAQESIMVESMGSEGQWPSNDIQFCCD